MNTTPTKRQRIVASLRDKEYRDLFVSEQVDTGLAFQIRAMRQARGWSQGELGERLGMTQEGISRLESLSYGRYNITTLKRIASAFDVAFVGRFEPFSRFADWVANLSPRDLAVPDFEHDPGLTGATTNVEVTQATVSAGEIKQGKIPYQLSSARPANIDEFAWREDSTAPTRQVANVG